MDLLILSRIYIYIYIYIYVCVCVCVCVCVWEREREREREETIISYDDVLKINECHIKMTLKKNTIFLPFSVFPSLSYTCIHVFTHINQCVVVCSYVWFIQSQDVLTSKLDLKYADLSPCRGLSSHPTHIMFCSFLRFIKWWIFFYLIFEKITFRVIMTNFYPVTTWWSYLIRET